jgi:hypothetical protein
VGHKLRKEVVRACCLDDEDLFSGVLLSPLCAAPASTPVDVVAAASGAVGLGSPGAAAGVPLNGRGGVTAGAKATGAAWTTGAGAV